MVAWRARAVRDLRRAERMRLSFRSALATSLLVSAGCSDAPYEVLGEAELAQTVCAAGEVVEGIRRLQVARRDPDLPGVAADGIHFAFMRAAYGTSKDQWFDVNWGGAKDNGVCAAPTSGSARRGSDCTGPVPPRRPMGPAGPGDSPRSPTSRTPEASPRRRSPASSRLDQPRRGRDRRKPIPAENTSGRTTWGSSTAFLDHPYWIPNYSYDCPNLPDGTWPNAPGTSSSTPTRGSVGARRSTSLGSDFNGTLAELTAFAGGRTRRLVSQSFPYAAEPPTVMYTGEELVASIELRNVGLKPWNEKTMLATTEPRDCESPFAGPEWPGKNRYAAVEGVVEPAKTYKFTFVLHAPDEPGT